MGRVVERGAGAAILATAILVQTCPAQSARFFVPKPELLFVPIAPCQAMDPARVGPLQGTRLLPVVRTKGCIGAIPLAAAAVALSLTVSEASTTGILAAYPPGAKPATDTAALAYSPGQSKTARIAVGIEGGSVFLKATNGSVRVTGYVTGYFVPQIAGTVRGQSIYASTRRVGDYLGDQIGVARKCALNAPIAGLPDPQGFASVGSGYNRARVVIIRFRYAPDGSFRNTVDDFQFAYHC